MSHREEHLSVTNSIETIRSDFVRRLFQLILAARKALKMVNAGLTNAGEPSNIPIYRRKIIAYSGLIRFRKTDRTLGGY